MTHLMRTVRNWFIFKNNSASRASVYTNAIFVLQNACWDSPKPFVNCIRRMQAAHLCQMLLHGLMRAESRREITPSCTTAGKPHDSVQMCTDSLLRTACMGNWDDWLDRFPFLTGKFITADFHADCLFLPLGYHLFMSFSCTFGYFLLFRYTLRYYATLCYHFWNWWQICWRHKENDRIYYLKACLKACELIWKEKRLCPPKSNVSLKKKFVRFCSKSPMGARMIAGMKAVVCKTNIL